MVYYNSYFIYKQFLFNILCILNIKLTVDVKCFSGKLKEAVGCLEKAIPLSKSEKELLHIFSLRDSAQAQLGVVERLGLKPQMFS